MRVGAGVAVSFAFGVALNGRNGLYVGYGLFELELDVQAASITASIVNKLIRRRDIRMILPKSRETLNANYANVRMLRINRR